MCALTENTILCIEFSSTYYYPNIYYKADPVLGYKLFKATITLLCHYYLILSAFIPFLFAMSTFVNLSDISS